MSEPLNLYASVRCLRAQAAWWLAFNSISRNRVHEEDMLRPKCMIFFELHLLDGLRISGYTDESFNSRSKGYPVPVHLTDPAFTSGVLGHSFDKILAELVAVEGRDGSYVLDFLASLWPDEWLHDEDGLRDYTLSIFSPFEIQETKNLLGLSRFLKRSGFIQQREYETTHVEKSIRGHTVSFNVWRFEKGKGLCIKKSFTIRLLIACWLPPFLVILGLCVMHLLKPDIGLGDILSLVGAGLSALAAWIPGVVLKGWQLGDAVRGKYYTTNLDTAQEVSKSKALKLASCYPSIRRFRATQEAHLEPATLLATAMRRGDATVVGNGACYFGLMGELRGTFSPLEITCDSGVPLEVLVLEPLGALKIPIPRKGRGTTKAYVNRGFFNISEVQRKSEATVHLEQPWQADLSKLQVLLSTRRSSARPYLKNGQLGELVFDSSDSKTLATRTFRKTWKSRFGNSYWEDAALLTRVLRGGSNLLLGGLLARSDEEMV
ncbi:hypothetical protein PGT21_004967 [Puccinia graminis f. sp. tritici]|uniref:Uncharacterized protein n=1 Tax=Puccinia graminis f. sp. tritici TaxID=56615 RepID=A0A5B0N4Y6_PUCGR|nr:hypothetical protein PGTUg99_035888 [Puccinia graminis f. sp. tritici]KAA1093970.1 hypothetical protein PGT21_004967 [Puccinia graminis f. sp. tritici]